MVAIGIVLIWLCLVYLASERYARGQQIEPAALFGLLLGRWPSTDNEPPSGIILVALGRLGALLVLLIVFQAVLAWSWWPALPALVLAGAGLAGLAILRGRGSSRAGLDEVRVFLRLPDRYQLFLGRVVAGGPLCGASLASLDWRKHGFLVLAIGRRHTREFIQFPKGQEVLGPGDLLVVYGCAEDAEGGKA